MTRTTVIALFPLIIIFAVAITAIGLVTDFINHRLLRKPWGPHIERDWEERYLLLNGPSNSR